MILPIKPLKWMAIPAVFSILVSCSFSDKRTTSTAFMDVAYLDDSLAALILIEATQREAFLGSPYIEKTTLITYKLSFNRQGAIEPLAPPVVSAGSYVPEYTPWVLGGELLLYTGSGTYGHLVHGGEAEPFVTDSCCVNWSGSPWEGTYVLKTRSAKFFRWKADSKEQFPLEADSVFGFSPEKWYDLNYHGGRWLGIYSDSGSFFLADRLEGAAPGAIGRRAIPGLEGIPKDTRILIYPGYDVILRGVSAPRSARFIRLSAVLSDTAAAAWAPFDRKHSFDLRTVYELDGSKLTFRSLDSNGVLSEYDLSKFHKPQP